MAISIIPKDKYFYDLLNKQAQFAIAAAVLFAEQTSQGDFGPESVKMMRDIEHQADEIAHEIMNRVNKTFITPFDREDIHSLTCATDDVIDLIYTISNRMKVYKITRVDSNLVEFASTIEKSVRALALAVQCLMDTRKRQEVLDACIEVHRLENVGDAMRDAIIGKLFESPTDIIQLIKWKEIYEFSENVLDLCEDAAHIVVTIIVKVS
ncbi:MAG: DUF47 family protein [Syntrophaceae bacterium]